MATEVPSVPPTTFALPLVSTKGGISVEEALARRRSVRHYLRSSISLRALSQILFAAQGITDLEGGFRTAPSAGALYPLELYVVVRKEGVEGLPEGVYHYEPKGHRLTLARGGDLSTDLEAATWNQGIVEEAAMTIVTTGILPRISEKYGRKGSQYMFQESGHAAQNAFLQATALGLGCVVMGAFSEGAVKKVIGAGPGERPLYLQPFGTPA